MTTPAQPSKRAPALSATVNTAGKPSLPNLDLTAPVPLTAAPYWRLNDKDPGHVFVEHDEGELTFRVTISGSPERVKAYVMSAKISVGAVPSAAAMGETPPTLPVLRGSIQSALEALGAPPDGAPGLTYVELADQAGLDPNDVARQATAYVYENFAQRLRNGELSIEDLKNVRFTRKLSAAMRTVAWPNPPTGQHLTIEFSLVRRPQAADGADVADHATTVRSLRADAADAAVATVFAGASVAGVLYGQNDSDGYLGTFINWVETKINVSRGSVTAALFRTNGARNSPQPINAAATPPLGLGLNGSESVTLEVVNDANGQSIYSGTGRGWKKIY